MDLKKYKNVSDILIAFILVAGTTFIIKFANALDMSILNLFISFSYISMVTDLSEELSDATLKK